MLALVVPMPAEVQVGLNARDTQVFEEQLQAAHEVGAAASHAWRLKWGSSSARVAPMWRQCGAHTAHSGRPKHRGCARALMPRTPAQ
jgi:hypothetical protein